MAERVTLQRTQLPLLLCRAVTIHKVQRLSLDAAVIDLGPKVFEDGPKVFEDGHGLLL